MRKFSGEGYSRLSGFLLRYEKTPLSTLYSQVAPLHPYPGYATASDAELLEFCSVLRCVAVRYAALRLLLA